MKNRIEKYLQILWLVVCTCCLFACGGGGGGGTSGPSVSGGQTITVAGKVSANIVYPGTVRIYGVNGDGTTKTPALVTGQTGSDGSYSVSIDGYQGAIVGIAFGSYTDEASRVVIDLPEGKCLYAALPESDVRGKSAVTLHISTLSDLAYRKARATIDFAANIAVSNQAVSQLFGVNIAGTPPVSFDADTLSNGTITGDQIRLATLLAAISQVAANGSANPLVPTATDMQNAQTLLADGITVANGVVQISPAAAWLLQQAGLAISTNSNSQPVITAGGSSAQTMLTTLATIGSAGGGTKTARFRLRTSGVYSGNLYGISVTVGIPAGFVVRTDSSGLTQTGVVVASGQSGTNSTAFGSVAGSLLTVGIGNPNGFGIGEFVTVYGEISAASLPPLPSEFTPITVIKISDEVGSPISGIAVEVF